MQQNKLKKFWQTLSRCIKRLRSNFNKANRNTKNDMINIMSKDDSIKETLYDNTLGKIDLNKKERS